MPVTNSAPGDRSQKVFRVSEAPHGGVVDDGSAARREIAGLLVEQQEMILPGVKEPGRDGIDPDFGRVFLSHVDGQPLREVADGRPLATL